MHITFNPFFNFILEGNATEALLSGAVYSYFVLNLARECYATRLFAQVYGMDIRKISSSLLDCLSMINSIFEGEF